jgi:hypothetical protein
MYFYPYAAPLPLALDWTGDTVGVALLGVSLSVATFIFAIAWRGFHRRVVRTVPVIPILSGRTQIPRAAA